MNCWTEMIGPSLRFIDVGCVLLLESLLSTWIPWSRRVTSAFIGVLAGRHRTNSGSVFGGVESFGSEAPSTVRLHSRCTKSAVPTHPFPRFSFYLPYKGSLLSSHVCRKLLLPVDGDNALHCACFLPRASTKASSLLWAKFRYFLTAGAMRKF